MWHTVEEENMSQILNEFIEINGCRQFLSIRSAGDGLPILLYLHGGPGDAALPLVAKYNRSLEEHFTVVIWEQRGAGKSYYPFGEGENITLSLFLEDLDAITAYVLNKFKQERLYLAGHSWGSVLGLQFCRLHPERLHAYIGCGQVVNMEKSSRLAHEYAMREAMRNGDVRSLKKLKRIDCSYTGEHWLDDLLLVTGQVVKYKGSLYGYKNYYPFVKEMILSREYSIADLIQRQRGALQSIRRLWPELMTVNFEGVTSFPVPIVFVEGRHDHHVSSDLARAYFDTVTTRKQFFWFENSCHFPQWSEASRFTEVICSALQNLV